MKNLSKKLAVLMTVSALAATQVSAAQFFTTKIEKNDYQITKTTDAFTKINYVKSWLSSLFNKMDYVAEDNLLMNYMLGKADEQSKDLKIAEEKLLSNYMLGDSNDSIAYSFSQENMSYAADFDDEYEYIEETFEE